VAVVKIGDVAREAGVSVATVSRALNGLATVDAELTRRVHEAAGRLGYRPNAIARGLRRRKTDVIALVISDIADPFFTAIARGVEDVAQAKGYSVLLCNADEDPGKEARYLEVAEIEQVAGVLLSPHSAATDISRLRSAGVPLVVVDRPLAEPVDSVMVRSVEGARAATTHLLEQGWLRPACITGPADAATAQQRLEGYEQALSHAGSSTPLSVHASFTQEGGSRAAAALLDADPSPDAFFVANTQMALGAIAELKRRGLRVSHDVGIITFDDAPWAPFLDPPVSVVAQPAYEIGRAAAELLMDRISGEETGGARSIVLATTLIVRESSRRA
jgi:LacI family transcriptional regulator